MSGYDEKVRSVRSNTNIYRIHIFGKKRITAALDTHTENKLYAPTIVGRRVHGKACISYVLNPCSE